MSVYITVIDGGTTSTRFTLLKDGELVTRVKKDVGAANAEDSFRNKPLEKAVLDTINEFESDYNCQISAILASGMITSNVGLKEIPHLEAPVTLEKMISNIRPHILEKISEDVSFYFIPGIKFNTNGNDLLKKDIMRGEETEIFGALTEDDKNKTIIFIHFGSHNKAILYKDNAITDSVTTMGGELMWVMCNNTILKSSVGDLDNFTIDNDYVLKGYNFCSSVGLTRSLFSARISNIIEKSSEDQVLSFILGAVIYSDIESFNRMLEKHCDKIVIYGRARFVSAFLICCEKYLPEIRNKIQAYSFDESENLSLKGISLIYTELKKELL